MAGRTSLVFIHGRHAERGDWVGAISAGLELTGGPALPPEMALVEVEYAQVLNSLAEHEPQSTPPPNAAENSGGQHAGALHALREHVPRPISPFDFAPKEWATRQIMNRMPEVERYRLVPGLQEAVRQEVLGQLPRGGPSIVVAHSLGSVVAFDALQHLPPGVEVELLLTIGSPMARKPWRRFLSDYRGRFPQDAARSWVNIVNRGDWVTGGDGVHLWFPQAIDTFARIGLGVHGECRYLASPPAGIAVGDALNRLAAARRT